MNNQTEEHFETVDQEGNVTGLAPRSELHNNPALIHRVVHVLVFDSEGRLLLQKRSMAKDVAPGKWDTSVGGHVNPGELMERAASREMKEELGIEAPLEFRHQYLFRNQRESELVYTFTSVHDGPFRLNCDEIDEVRFWEIEEIRGNLGSGVFSGQFEREFKEYFKK